MRVCAFTWQRKVAKNDQVTRGGRHQYYSVGRAYTRRAVLVRFDPQDRHFVFFNEKDPDKEIAHLPARRLDPEDLTGLAV